MRLRQCSLGSRIRPSAGDHAYLYGPSLTPVAQVDGSGTVEYLHGDVLGSVRAITDSTGAVVGASTFDAFGSRTAHTGTGDSLFGFTGAWTDPAVDSTRQPYAYTGNSPLQRTDPSGLDFIQDVYDNAVNAMVAGSQALNCGLEQVAAFGAGALDSLTFGLSSMVLSAAVPGYDEFVAGHEAAFTAGSITATVVQAAVMIIATAGAGAGLAVGLIVLKTVIKSAVKTVVKAVERTAVRAVERAGVRAAERAGVRAGSGPVSGVLEASAGSKSYGALRAYNPKQGIEYVFDPANGTFAVGRPASSAGLRGSPHQQLAQSIGANPSTVVGGTLIRDANGVLNKTENSGHFWQNWTNEIREQFVRTMQGYGLDVVH